MAGDVMLMSSLSWSMSKVYDEMDVQQQQQMEEEELEAMEEGTKDDEPQ